MNILYLTMSDFSSLDTSGVEVHTDLLREFVARGHKVYIVSPVERKHRQPTKLIDNGNYIILKLRIGDFQKSNPIVKGISTLTLDLKYLNAIKKFFSNVKFDLVIYTTPPIEVVKAVKYVKKRDMAQAYLLLKDIFPQNAVDLGLLSKRGPMALLYHYFRQKEKNLYAISDYIGCMSKANVEYLLCHNNYLDKMKVEVCPNSIEPVFAELDNVQKEEIRKKYNIPMDRTIFAYGGNLSKPQGIPFIIKCLEANKANEQVFFVIIGSGSEFGLLKNYFSANRPSNAKLIAHMPKVEYDKLLNVCDVGLVFLDYRFTIPNFPARLLSYMQASMPVLAATDLNTDIGQVIETNEFGLWCHSTDVEAFSKNVTILCNRKLREKFGVNARKFLIDNYTTKKSYNIIMKHFQ